MTILSHFYNEEYLLPFWLNHHKKIFDNGILIDYGSNDASIDIIKTICPSWKIIPSRNEFFDANQIDLEVEDIESSVSGWRICLNITEFIIGDFGKLPTISEPTNILIPGCVMVDSPDNEFTDINENSSLICDRTFGIEPFTSISNFKIRRARKLSNFFSKYPLGRHYEKYNTTDFLVLWYGYSPFNDRTIKRKLQIQHKIPRHDISRGFGYEHIITQDELIRKFKIYQEASQSLNELILKYTKC